MPFVAQSKKLIRLYEFVDGVVVYCHYIIDNPLCLMTIATWYHSFPSRTGQ